MLREKQIYSLSGGLHTNLSFAVLGNARSFKRHKHVWKVWRALRDFGCHVYPVIPGLSWWEGVKLYPELAAVTGKVDVVVTCSLPEEIPDLVAQVKACGCQTIWFQEQTWNEDLQLACDNEGIQTVRGCVLLHKEFSKPFCFLNPCYWHGLYDTKVPLKRKLSWQK